MKTITAYHGSPSKFEAFSTEKIGSTTGTAGAGFGVYFTNKAEEANGYGENLYTVELNISNGLSNDKITLSKAQVTAILKDYEEQADNSYIENFRSLCEAVNNLIEYSRTDSEIIGDIIQASGCKETLFSILKKHGYNHTRANGGTIYGLPTVNWVMFDASDIKIIKRTESK